MGLVECWLLKECRPRGLGRRCPSTSKSVSGVVVPEYLLTAAAVAAAAASGDGKGGCAGCASGTTLLVKSDVREKCCGSSRGP